MDLKVTPPMKYDSAGFDIEELTLTEVDRVEIVRGRRYSFIRLFKGDKVVEIEVEAQLTGGYLPDVETRMDVEIKNRG